MNICECGCGQVSTCCTAEHNGKVKGLHDQVGDNNMETVKEVTDVQAENYDLTNVSESVTINYEAGKRWLDKTFLRYNVRVNHNKENIPYEIVLSAANYNVGEHGTWLIGKGKSFSNALKELLINV
jgi:hypothetical protein